MSTNNTGSRYTCTYTSTYNSVPMLSRSRRSQMSTCMHSWIHGQTLCSGNNSKADPAPNHTVQMLPRIHRSKVPAANHFQAYSATYNSVQMLSRFH